MKNYMVQIVFLVNGKSVMETHEQVAADGRTAYFLAVQNCENAGARIVDSYITEKVGK